MNHIMWANAATRANIGTLVQRGVQVFGPPKAIRRAARAARAACSSARAHRAVGALLSGSGVLAGRRVLITAGPTRERIDPVRFISNRSSGKMGFAVAQAAREAGATVVLISGPVSLPTPAGVTRVDVESAATCWPRYSPRCPERHLHLHGRGRGLSADARRREQDQEDHRHDGAGDAAHRGCARHVAARADRPFVVGFAAETEAVEQNARTKLMKKNLDMIAANEVGHDKAFDCEDNQLIVLSATGATSWGGPASSRSHAGSSA